MRPKKKGISNTTIALILCLALLLPAIPVLTAERDDGEDPFATMYDSAALIEQELEQLEQDYALEDAALQEEIAEAEMLLKSIPLSEKSSVVDNSDGRKQQKQQIQEEVAEKQKVRILKAQEKEQQKQEYEEHLKETRMIDRFIVKYKTGNSGTVTNFLPDSRAIPLNVKNAPEQSYELILTKEKVNPLELAQKLQKTSAAREIAYIQPDLALTLAELSDNPAGESEASTGESETSASAEQEQDNSTSESEVGPVEPEPTLPTEESVDPEQPGATDEEEPDPATDDQQEQPTPDQQEQPGDPVGQGPGTGSEPQPNHEENPTPTTEQPEPIDTDPLPSPAEVEQDILTPTEEVPLPALNTVPGANSVLVALIDTGVDIHHTFLQNYIWEPWDILSQSEQTYDPQQPLESAHGTHIAGSIVRIARDSQADVRVMPIKAFSNGTAYTSDIIGAIHHAEQKGATIINCSFGSTAANPALEEAVANSSALFVCAVGNNRADLAEQPVYPAAYRLPNVLAVGAVNADGGYSYFSNYSPDQVDLTALGRDVESSLPEEDTGTMSGTSMSAAQVTGVAAVVASLCADTAGVTLPEQEKQEGADAEPNPEPETALSSIEEDIDAEIETPDQSPTTQIQSADPSPNDTAAGETPIEPVAPTASNEQNEQADNVDNSESFDLEPTAGQDLVPETEPTEPAETLPAVNDSSPAFNHSAWTAEALRQRLLVGADRLPHLENKVDQGRRLNLDNALSGTAGIELNLNPADDFDVLEYAPSDRELFTLYNNAGDIIQIVAGSNHTLILKANGTVWAWGRNSYGQCGRGHSSYSEQLIQVIGLSDITKIAAGSNHSLAIKQDGTLWVWGYNTYGQLGDGTETSRTSPIQINGLTNIIDIAAGNNHSVFLKQDGTAMACGYGNYGQLGNNSTAYKTTPVDVQNLTNANAVAAGSNHSMALKQDGTVSAWGYNNYGQLGDNSVTRRLTPVAVRNISQITAIAAGHSHSLAVKQDGTLWVWGYNNYGQLGNGSTTNQKVPVAVSNLTDVVAASGGQYYSLALSQDGTVSAWGHNAYGQLGNNSVANSLIPVAVQNLSGATAIAAGSYHSVAIKQDHTVWAWGSNVYGQLGLGLKVSRGTPTQVGGLTNITAVSTYAYHNLALKADGTVWAWGFNWFSQLGDATTIDRIAPVQVNNLSDITAIAAGYKHSLALKADGTVWAWGSNTECQLGIQESSSPTAIQIPNLTGVAAIAAGEAYSLALKADGTVWAWGSNYYGELGNGTSGTATPVMVQNLTDIIAISAGSYHNLALKADGTVSAWGRNQYGQLGDGSTVDKTSPVAVSNLTDVSAITAGFYHSLALKTTGTLVGWGYNYYGQLGDSSRTDRHTPVAVKNLTTVKDMSVGGFHSLAVRQTGSLWAWGDNLSGQMGDGSWTLRSTPQQLSGFTNGQAVSGGELHSLVLKTDGTVWAWGRNIYGSLGLPYQNAYLIPTEAQTRPDDPRVKLENALPIPIDSAPFSLIGELKNSQDSEAYRFDLNPGVYSLTIQSANPNLIAALYDSNLNLISPNLIKNGDTWQLTLSVTTAATYYLLVSYDPAATFSACPFTVNITYLGLSSEDLEIDCQIGQTYLVAIKGQGLQNFATTQFNLEYDQALLTPVALLDPQRQSLDLELGPIPGSYLEITGLEPGKITGQLNKTIPANETWQGTVGIIKFQATATGTAGISCSYTTNE